LKVTLATTDRELEQVMSFVGSIGPKRNASAPPCCEPGEVDTANASREEGDPDALHDARSRTFPDSLSALAAPAAPARRREQRSCHPSRTQRTITDSVTVVALNQDTRLITVQDKEGHKLKFKVGDMVRNLPQSKSATS